MADLLRRIVVIRQTLELRCRMCSDALNSSAPNRNSSTNRSTVTSSSSASVITTSFGNSPNTQPPVLIIFRLFRSVGIGILNRNRNLNSNSRPALLIIPHRLHVLCRSNCTELGPTRLLTGHYKTPCMKNIYKCLYAESGKYYKTPSLVK